MINKALRKSIIAAFMVITTQAVLAQTSDRADAVAVSRHMQLLRISQPLAIRLNGIMKACQIRMDAVLKNRKITTQERKEMFIKARAERDVQIQSLLTPEQLAVYKQQNDAFFEDNRTKLNNKAELNIRLISLSGDSSKINLINRKSSIKQ